MAIAIPGQSGVRVPLNANWAASRASATCWKRRATSALSVAMDVAFDSARNHLHRHRDGAQQTQSNEKMIKIAFALNRTRDTPIENFLAPPVLF
jgi:hypothetical protein